MYVNVANNTDECENLKTYLFKKMKKEGVKFMR